jgi:hypothetical protein
MADTRVFQECYKDVTSTLYVLSIDRYSEYVGFIEGHKYVTRVLQGVTRVLQGCMGIKRVLQVPCMCWPSIVTVSVKGPATVAQ